VRAKQDNQAQGDLLKARTESMVTQLTSSAEAEAQFDAIQQTCDSLSAEVHQDQVKIDRCSLSSFGADERESMRQHMSQSGPIVAKREQLAEATAKRDAASATLEAQKCVDRALSSTVHADWARFNKSQQCYCLLHDQMLQLQEIVLGLEHPPEQAVLEQYTQQVFYAAIPDVSPDNLYSVFADLTI